MPRNRNRNRQNNHDHNQAFSQRELLNLYLNLYNDTSRQIDLLYISLDEIRNIINNISGVNRPVTSPRPNPIIPNSNSNSNSGSNSNSIKCLRRKAVKTVKIVTLVIVSI